MSNVYALLVSPGGESVLVSPGGVDFQWMPGTDSGTGPVAVSYRRKKHYTRKDDLIEIYAANPQDAPETEPVDRKPRVAKPAAKPAEPEQVIRLSEVQTLAQDYGQEQAYRAALKRKDWERMAKLYERLMDEQDVEILLMYA